MATLFPAQKQTYDSPTGADNLDSPDHATNFNRVADTSEAMQDVVGTTLGTNVLKAFTDGDIPVRQNTSNVLQTEVSGTIDNGVFGTPAIFKGTADNIVIGTSSITGGTIIMDNNVAYQSKQAGGAVKDVMKLNTSNVLILSQLRHQNENANLITSSTEENVLEQSGWIQIEVSGAPISAEQEVTFPTAFDTILSVHITMGGFKSTAMANVTAMTGDTGKAISAMSALSTTAVTVRIQSGDGSNMVNGFYQVHWIAKGTKA